MDPFPQEHELIAFFECEPTLLNNNGCWFYDRLTFDSVRGQDRIVCMIEPASEILHFKWTQDDIERINLALNWVNGIQLKTGGGVEQLQLSFRSCDLDSITIQLKPFIAMELSTPADPPVRNDSRAN